MKLYILVLSVLLSGVSTVCAEERARTKPVERIIGLVEVPEIFGTAEGPGSGQQTPVPNSAPLNLLVEPRTGAQVSVTVRSERDLISRESDYEIRSAVVTDARDGWFKLKTEKSEGWLEPRFAGRFHPLMELYTESLTYLTAEWNGRVFHAAGKKDGVTEIPVDHVTDGDNEKWATNLAGAEVIESQNVDGQLWLKVKVFHPDVRCEGTEPRESAEGWIPAYADSGELNVWFYSRGC